MFIPNLGIIRGSGCSIYRSMYDSLFSEFWWMLSSLVVFLIKYILIIGGIILVPSLGFLFISRIEESSRLFHASRGLKIFLGALNVLFVGGLWYYIYWKYPTLEGHQLSSIWQSEKLVIIGACSIALVLSGLMASALGRGFVSWGILGAIFPIFFPIVATFSVDQDTADARREKRRLAKLKAKIVWKTEYETDHEAMKRAKPVPGSEVCSNCFRPVPYVKKGDKCPGCGGIFGGYTMKEIKKPVRRGYCSNCDARTYNKSIGDRCSHCESKFMA